MQITFAPTGEVVTGVGVTVTPQYSVGLGELAQPVYTTPSGYTPVQTILASGSPAAIIAGASAGYYVRFFAGENKTLMVTEFKMVDADALETARTTINAALASADAELTLNADGSAGS